MSESPPTAPEQPSTSGGSQLLNSSGTSRTLYIACDACRSIKIRCNPKPGLEKCDPCIGRNVECIRSRRQRVFPGIPRNKRETPPEPISVPDSDDHSTRGKGRMRYQLLRLCRNVEDLATARISLPACLLEPIPSLEYWCHLDRPDLFAAINDSEDPLQRMLSVIRFCFSKDLKLAKGEAVKPYDSFCGEYFRSYFDVPTNAVSFASPDPSEPPMFSWYLEEAETATSPVIPLQNTLDLPHSITPSVKENTELSDRHDTQPSADLQGINLNQPHNNADGLGHRVVFLKEKISDDPPTSAYWFECFDKGLEASGIDQVSASTTGVFGNIVDVVPGPQNKGIFVRITKAAGSGESYRITHPRGSVKGFVAENPYVVLTDSTVITCSGGNGKQLRAIIEYKDKPASRYPKFEVEGTIFTYTEGPEQESWREVIHVPKELVVATFDGCWRKAITWTKAGSDRKWPLIDLSQLAVVPKKVPPIREQHSNESRRFWENVTRYIRRKNFSRATQFNQAIEKEQQAVSVARKQFGIQFHASYFGPDISSGAPTLTPEGRRILMEEAHAFHESSATSSAASSIQQPSEPALKGSPKSLVSTVGQVVNRVMHWHRQGKRQKTPDSDHLKPAPKRKKRERRRLRKRGSGSSSGSGELAYAVRRSSGSGELPYAFGHASRSGEFGSNQSRGGSGSSIGSPEKPSNRYANEYLRQGTISGAGYSPSLYSGLGTGENLAPYMGDMDGTASPMMWGSSQLGAGGEPAQSGVDGYQDLYQRYKQIYAGLGSGQLPTTQSGSPSSLGQVDSAAAGGEPAQSGVYGYQDLYQMYGQPYGGLGSGQLPTTQSGSPSPLAQVDSAAKPATGEGETLLSPGGHYPLHPGVLDQSRLALANEERRKRREGQSIAGTSSWTVSGSALSASSGQNPRLLDEDSKEIITKKGVTSRNSAEYIKNLEQLVQVQQSRNQQLESELAHYRDSDGNTMGGTGGAGDIAMDSIEPILANGGNGTSPSGMRSSGNTDEPSAIASYVPADSFSSPQVFGASGSLGH